MKKIVKESLSKLPDGWFSESDVSADMSIFQLRELKQLGHIEERYTGEPPHRCSLFRKVLAEGSKKLLDDDVKIIKRMINDRANKDYVVNFVIKNFDLTKSDAERIYEQLQLT